MSEEKTTENEIAQEPKETESTEQHYIDAINAMKQNTVSKEAYQKVVQENKNLVDSLAKGQAIITEGEKKVLREPQVVYDDLFNNPNHTNQEIGKLMLEYRETMLAHGYNDPLLPQGPNAPTVTDNDIHEATKLQNHIEDALEKADGDPGLYTQYLMKDTKDATFKHTINRSKK